MTNSTQGRQFLKAYRFPKHVCQHPERQTPLQVQRPGRCTGPAERDVHVVDVPGAQPESSNTIHCL